MSLLTPFLSARGRAARMPEGIRVWGERAARAGALDATMGVITAPMEDNPETYAIASLPQIREAFGAWKPAEVFPYAPVAGTRAFRAGWRGWIGRKAAGDFSQPGPLEERTRLVHQHQQPRHVAISEVREHL